MPRNRMIKPDFWNDEKLGTESESIQLTFIGTWTFSDDYGVVRANPMWLKNQIFPYKANLRIEVFSKWLEVLEGHDVLVLFTVRNEKYYYIRTFRQHQSVEKPSKTRNCSEEELKAAMISLGYEEQENGSWQKKGELSENSRVVVGEHSEPKRSVSVSISKSEVKRANALVVSGETTEERNRQTKSKYKELITALQNEDTKTVWTDLKEFIRENTPGFIEPYVDAWNLFAENYGLSKIEAVSDGRKRKFNTRVQEKSFDFLKVLEKIKTSRHLRGDNQRGWKVTFDWIIENDKNYLKIIEGNYDV
jgi:hypothetical protein